MWIERKKNYPIWNLVPCYCSRVAQTATDFADASHSKSAKSVTTTVSYGIFSSENAYPCTVTNCNHFLPNFKINYIELVKNIDIDVEQIDLYIQLGTQDAASTAILVGTIAALLGIILKKPKYQVIPDYLNKNFLKIKLNCIFSIYLMQYIYKLILERKKRGIIRSKRWRR